MTAPELLAELERRGVRARVVGDRLRLAPAESLDDELLAELQAAKPELLRALAERTAPVECFWCGAPLPPGFAWWPDGVVIFICGRCRRWTRVGAPA